jgi:hypothetical protein
MSGPDFIIIGAMKCGTTSLAADLAAQADVFFTSPKEPNYFSDDAVFAQGPDWYAGLFADAKPNDLKGEGSTHYTKLPTHPHTLDRISALPEGCRFIYMIRNPVARAMSHYIHEWSQGIITTDPEAAFQSHPELVDYGRYAWQIAPWLQRFGADRILLTSLEQFTAHPQVELDRIGAFLGRSFTHVEMGAQNASVDRFRPLPMSGLLVNNPVAEFLRRSLVPKSLREKIRKARSIQTHPDLPDALRRQLEARFLADRAELSRAFPRHPALDLCYPFAPEARQARASA